MRALAISLLSAVVFAAAASPATATFTSVYDGPSQTLTVTSDASGDTIVFTCPSANLLINGANPTGGARPCNSIGTLSVTGNGGADTLDASGLEGQSAGAITVDGGEGNDDTTGVYLASSGQVATLLGGPGNDLLTSNSSDSARGGPGDDRLVGPVQAGGTLAGDQGTDTFAFSLPGASPVSFRFDVSDGGLAISATGVPTAQVLPWASIEIADLVLNDGAQTVDGSGFAGRLRVDAKGGADTITGTPNADVLSGGTGNDFIEGASGADVYQGGPGLDLLHARDGVADSGDCGTDEDALVADAVDALTGCERIDLPAPARDVSKPKLRIKRATLARRKLRLPVTCPKSEARCAGLVTVVAVGKRNGKTVRLKLGTIVFKIAGGKTKTLTRAVPRKRRRAVRAFKQARLRVKFDVLDAAGNRAKGVKRVGLRR